MKKYQFSDYPLWTALITPFHKDGSVHYENLKTLLTAQEKANNGVLILGSTGEALNISLVDRKEIIDFCQKQNLNVPIMVGVGGAMLEETKSWVEWLNTKSIHSLLLVTPLYAKPGRFGQTNWFETLMDTSKFPCLLYNVPSRSGMPLNLDTVNDLKDHYHFFGVKEASGSTLEFSKYSKITKSSPNKALMFCGDDALMPEFTEIGADGLISVASNVWPEQTHEYTIQNLEKRFTDSALWKQAAQSLFIASNPIPAKCLLKENGTIDYATVHAPLNENDLMSLAPLIEADQMIKDWNFESK